MKNIRSSAALAALLVLLSFAASNAQERTFQGFTQSIVIRNAQEAAQALKAADVLVVGLFYNEKAHEYKDYNAVTFSLPRSVVTFYHSFSGDVHDYFEARCGDRFPCIFISRGIDQEGNIVKKRQYVMNDEDPEDWTPSSLAQWVTQHMLPVYTVQPTDNKLKEEQFKFVSHTNRPQFWHLVATDHTGVVSVNPEFARAAHVLHHEYNFSCTHYQVDLDIQQGNELMQIIFNPEDIERAEDELLGGHHIYLLMDKYDNYRTERKDLDYDGLVAIGEQFAGTLSPRTYVKLRSGYRKASRDKAAQREVEKAKKKEKKAAKAAKKAEREEKKKRRKENKGKYDEL